MPEFLPERFEAGTVPTPAIVSLLAGIEYINNVGLQNIEEKNEYLTEKFADVIRSVEKCVLYEYGNGVLSFNISGVPANVVSDELDKFGICTRSGLHCAPLAHDCIGTLEIGTVRLSTSYFNTDRDIDYFYKILRAVNKKY